MGNFTNCNNWAKAKENDKSGKLICAMLGRHYGSCLTLLP